MKSVILAIMLSLSLTSCQTIQTAFKAITSQLDSKDDINTTHEPKTAIEQSTDKLTWLMVACLIGGVVTFALGFKMPFLSHISGIMFIGAGSAWCIIEALSIIESIKWIIIIGGVCFGGFYWYHKSKYYNSELSFKDNIIDDLGLHFDDNEGVEKLSKEAQARYILARPLKHTPVKKDKESP